MAPTPLPTGLTVQAKTVDSIPQIRLGWYQSAMSRVFTNLILLASMAALGVVAWYFASEYREVERRKQILLQLRATGESDGACAGLD